MAIKYKIDVLAQLKEKGYSAYRLRKEKILGEASIQKLRKDELVSWDNINTICELLQCDIGDVLIYVQE